MTRLRYILALILIFCCVGAGAQRNSRNRYPGRRQAQSVRLAATSHDPAEDSLIFIKMRKKMEDIRRK